MNKIHSKCLEFIGAKTQELIKNGISVSLTNKQDINGKYAGVFCGKSKCLSVAMANGHASVYVFIHEYAHYLQWRDKRKFWDSCRAEGFTKFSRWLSGGYLNAAELELAYYKSVELEYDAELTALQLISEYKLPLNIEECTRQANSNLLFYTWVRLNRSWGNGLYPVEDECVEQRLGNVLIPLSTFTNMKKSSKLLVKSGVLLPDYTPVKSLKKRQRRLSKGGIISP